MGSFKQKGIALVLAIGIFVTIKAQTVGEYYTLDDLTYKVLSTNEVGGTLEVAGITSTTDDVLLTIPAVVELEGQKYQVVSIADNAFSWSSFKTVDMSAATNLQRIGASAFAECRQIETVIFPPSELSSLTEIGPLAFHHDFALKSMNLEDTRLTVLESLFSKNERDEISIPGLKTLRLPNTLKEIKPYALQFLDITEIEIPSSITVFANRVLEGCIYLRKFIWKDAQITKLPFYTFLGDDKLEKVVLLTVDPLDPDGLSDRHFYMNDKDLLRVYVTEASYNNLIQGGYTNEESVFSTLAIYTDNDDEYHKGDANGDGSVNAADIVEVVNSIMGTPSAAFVFKAADVNGDGSVNAADIVLIVNIIMSAT